MMNVKPDISWADFEKLDIRCGTIISVNDFEKARNPSYQLEIDFGDIISRTNHYALQQRKFSWKTDFSSRKFS